MAEGIFYLRPSKDISLGHTIYPDTLTDGYLAISEEASDDDETYLKGSGESVFAFSGVVPEKLRSIKTANIYLDFTSGPYVHGGCERNIQVKLYVNESEVHTYEIIDNKTVTWESISITDEDIGIINEFIISKGVMPAIWLSVDFDIDFMSASNGKGGGYSNLTQMSISLFYQQNIGIYDKVGGEQRPATAAYQKINGTWSEISEDEAKTILKNNTIRRG